jgi:hypothetical protein
VPSRVGPLSEASFIFCISFFLALQYLSANGAKEPVRPEVSKGNSLPAIQTIGSQIFI